MKIRLFLVVLFLVSLALTVRVYACGETTLQQPADYWIVRVETGVGSRCGQLFHYGTFATFDEADRWQKANYANVPETTRVSMHEVHVVTTPPAKK